MRFAEAGLSVHERNVMESLAIRTQLEQHSLADIWTNTRQRVTLDRMTSGATEQMRKRQHKKDLKIMRKKVISHER
jgi:hypothetical protein